MIVNQKSLSCNSQKRVRSRMQLYQTNLGTGHIFYLTSLFLVQKKEGSLVMLTKPKDIYIKPIALLVDVHSEKESNRTALPRKST